MNEHKKLAIFALENLKGDDHIRARLAFKGYSPEQMKKEYGRSGETCEDILNGYEKRVSKIDAAINWLQNSI